MTLKHRVVLALRKRGIDLARYRPDRHPDARRSAFMRHLGIDLVVDVGANTGQYGSGLRRSGYGGRIVSFEPLPDAFNRLLEHAANDQKWEVRNCALGSKPGESLINVAGNSTSSSLLKMLPTHERAAPQSRYLRQEPVSVDVLDRVLPEIRGAAQRIWLKIDTQGFELEVLKGAKESLRDVLAIQLEFSLQPLYDGAPSFNDLWSLLQGEGFRLTAADAGFTDVSTGEMLQADLTFIADPG